MGPAGFAAATGVSRETMARLEAYAELLVTWSSRINLIAHSTLADLWRRHFLDSAQLQPFIPKGATSVIDLGSGAGFPGLVLAILGAVGVELIEADSRKAAFLREAARIAGAAVTVRGCRIEAVPPHPADVVTARGCAPLDRLLPLAGRFIGPHTTCLLLKGARAAEELTAARKAWTMRASLHPSRADPAGSIVLLQQVAREPRRT
ncbi:MAG TPA: 16S rRNA (guanine(527)-N(7))-methyltransferase RsmG [Stellaceae bacterium]|nr:16S rRNA (guanine(527)-N(7))-methyltransferase RsmG [Stellaceae bacterium]